jgi:phage baseplate assembly protein W
VAQPKIKDFVGRGWISPFQFDPTTGGVAKDRGEGTDQKLNRVGMALTRIFNTRRGEVFMARGQGSRLRDSVFGLDSEGIEGQLQFEATLAVEGRPYGEPRVVLERAEARVERPTKRAFVEVVVALRSTNVAGNIVVPFYLDEPDKRDLLRGGG